jgi:hypothetical protein
MPRYLASQHAVTRLLERFPVLAPVAGRGLAAAQWLGRLATRAHVIAQQSGMDLMLCLDLPVQGGPVRIYLPVTPMGHHDTWAIRTVLTEQQGMVNISESDSRRQDAASAAWRQRKGFTRPYLRRERRDRRQSCPAAA